MAKLNSSGKGCKIGKECSSGSYDFGKETYGLTKDENVSVAGYIHDFFKSYKADVATRFYNSRQYRNLLQPLPKELYVTPTLRRYNRTELEERTKKYRKICPLCGSELLSEVHSCGFRYSLN